MIDFERTEQNLLLIGDWYTAKLYEVIRDELYLEDWKPPLRDKLDNVQNIIGIIQENLLTCRGAACSTSCSSPAGSSCSSDISFCSSSRISQFSNNPTTFSQRERGRPRSCHENLQPSRRPVQTRPNPCRTVCITNNSRASPCACICACARMAQVCSSSTPAPLQLNPTAAEYAYHYIKGTPPADAAREVASRYRIARAMRKRTTRLRRPRPNPDPYPRPGPRFLSRL